MYSVLQTMPYSSTQVTMQLTLSSTLSHRAMAHAQVAACCMRMRCAWSTEHATRLDRATSAATVPRQLLG